MNEMKPEDVMRALECCVIQCAECRKCPMLHRKDNRGTCYTELKRLALALLRENDAKIAELQSIAEFQQSSNMKRHFELQEKDKQIKAKDAEIERLKNDLAISKKVSKRYMTSHKQVRTEVITEFAEKLKRRFNVWNNAMYSETTVQSIITKVTKEMEETLRENNDC